MRTLWNRIKASGGVGVCWLLGAFAFGLVINNALRLPQSEVMIKSVLIAVGLLFNSLAIVNRRRGWIGLMTPFYLFGIVRDLFWQETTDWPIAIVFMALTIVIPITFFAIPSTKSSR